MSLRQSLVNNEGYGIVFMLISTYIAQMRDDLPLSVTHEVRDRCLCLHVQRAARALARHFDEALRPVGLTHGQYSLLISLNRPQPPRISDVAHLLAMDRTTLTANLKPLERRGFLKVKRDPDDGRTRRLHLTEVGRDTLQKAVPIWRSTHDKIDTLLTGETDSSLRPDLMALSFGQLPD